MNQHFSYADVTVPFILPHLFAAYKDINTDTHVYDALKLLRTWHQQWSAIKERQYGTANTIIETWLRELLKSAFADDVGKDMFYLYATTGNPNKESDASKSSGPGVRA